MTVREILLIIGCISFSVITFFFGMVYEKAKEDTHGVIDELEKIAKEMKSSNQYSFEDLKIIDKHITEIKGE